jgi:hypothetical protein
MNSNLTESGFYSVSNNKSKYTRTEFWHIQLYIQLTYLNFISLYVHLTILGLHFLKIFTDHILISLLWIDGENDQIAQQTTPSQKKVYMPGQIDFEKQNLNSVVNAQAQKMPLDDATIGMIL